MTTMTREISNYDDVIDSRDVIARIGELESNVDRLTELEAIDKDDIAPAEVAEWGVLCEQVENETAELDALRALAEEASASADWQYGEALIRDSYFVQYAEQLADDLGVIDSNAGWPLRHIDWQAAADELKQDYFDVDFDGVTYWIR